MNAAKVNEALDLGIAAAPQIYKILRQRIIRGEIEPGTRISEAEIALGFNVSRQPAREAFIKLADEALLEVRPQRGTFVRKIVVSAVMDARFVREAIEADIVKLLAREPSDVLITDLRAQLKEQLKATRDPVRFIELDEYFHRSLAQAAGKVHAWTVVEATKAQMDRVRHLALQHFPMEALTDQHTAIVDTIARGDVVAAEASIRAHLQAILVDLPEVSRAWPSYFESGA